MKWKRFTSAAAVLVAAALIFGCGGSPSAPPPPPTGTPTPTPVPVQVEFTWIGEGKYLIERTINYVCSGYPAVTLWVLQGDGVLLQQDLECAKRNEGFSSWRFPCSAKDTKAMFILAAKGASPHGESDKKIRHNAGEYTLVDDRGVCTR